MIKARHVLKFDFQNHRITLRIKDILQMKDNWKDNRTLKEARKSAKCLLCPACTSMALTSICPLTRSFAARRFTHSVPSARLAAILWKFTDAAGNWPESYVGFFSSLPHLASTCRCPNFTVIATCPCWSFPIISSLAFPVKVSPMLMRITGSTEEPKIRHQNFSKPAKCTAKRQLLT